MDLVRGILHVPPDVNLKSTSLFKIELDSTCIIRNLLMWSIVHRCTKYTYR